MNSFEKIVNNPLLIKVLKKGSKVIRLRTHNQENEVFKKKNQVTYPPSDKAGLMRANLKGEAMFYGAIFSEDKNNIDLPRLTCLFETNKDVLNDEYIGKKDLTYSAWRNKRDINLFVIPVFDSYTKPPIDFIWYFNMWKNLIEEFNFSNEDVMLLKELSTKFAFIPQNQNEEIECYSYTAQFTKDLLSKFKQIDGIMYPSTKLGKDGMGINVAIRPEIIDKDFELTNCAICRFFKRSKSQQLILTYKIGKIHNNGAISYRIDKDYFDDIDIINKQDPSFEINNLEFKY